MKENSNIAIAQDQEIPCLLIPLDDVMILAPTVTVAEMAAMAPLEPIPDSPSWLLGMFRWRNIQVPVVLFETLNGCEGVEVNAEGRIAVFNNTGVSTKLPFIAIATQGIPRMSRVSPSDIVENTDVDKKPYDLMAVKVGLEELTIPDVSAIERAYIELGLIE